MILQVSITAFIFLILYLLRVWYLSPKNTIKNYIKSMKNKGYIVKQFPYHPLRNHFDYLLQNPRKDGDAYRVMRDQYPQYDLIVSNVFNSPIIQICHPAIIKDYYSVDKHYQYPKQKKIIQQIVRIAGLGLALSQGENWKRKRKIFNTVFNFQFIKSQTYKIAQICDYSIKQMEKHARIGKQSQQLQYNILDLTVKIFSNVILSNFLGMEKQEKIQSVQISVYLKNLIDQASQDTSLVSMLLGLRFLSLGIRKNDRQINRKLTLYRTWALGYIRQKVKSIQQNLTKNPKNLVPSNLIQALIMYNKQNGMNIKDSITSQQQILQQFNTFFFAGTDTTSNYTQMMIYYIALNPQVQKKLRKEIQEYMKQDNYSYENLKNFKYIDNIQKQTTRMYGPIPFIFVRVAKQDNYLGDIPIKKGTLVNIVQQASHYNQRYFKNSKQFRPDRWDFQCDDIPPFAFGGFSFGARTCIGKHLALLESKIALIKFMKRYNKIILPKQNFKMGFQFLPCPEIFDTKLVPASRQ